MCNAGQTDGRLNSPVAGVGRSILFLLSSLTVGGSEKKAVRIANALRAAGEDVQIAYLNPPTTLRSEIRNELQVTHLQRKGKLSLTSVRLLTELIEKSAIDQIVCINLYPVIYAHLAGIRLPLGARPRLVLSINTTEHGSVKERMSMAVYAPLMRRLDAIVFGSRVQQDLWQRRYRLDDEKCSIIYNGVDTNWFSPTHGNRDSIAVADAPTRDSGNFIIAAIGRLRPVKNQAEVVQALPLVLDQIPDVQLVLVGDGSERENIRDTAKRCGVGDRVSFVGNVTDVRSVLERIDLFVLPSISETFSNATLEAMAMGVPVLLSDVGGAAEMIEDSVSGLLYNSGDVRELADRIIAVASDPGYRRSLGEKGRERVLRRFSIKHMVDEFRLLLRL